MNSPKYAPGDNDAPTLGPPSPAPEPTLSQAMQAAYRTLPAGTPFRWLEARRIAVAGFTAELAELLEERDAIARTVNAALDAARGP